jgi:hypothetical protein
MSLKARFEQFMSVFPGAENIDALMRDCDLPGRKSADYLAFNRSCIIEQKSLDSDPAHKVQSFVNELFRKRTIIGCGQNSLGRIIETQPDAEQLKAELYGRAVRVVDDNIADADKQIRDTKKTFLNPEAVGLVILLNEAAQLISPDFVLFRAFEVLRRRLTLGGDLRYPHVEGVILISEGIALCQIILLS